MSIRPIDLPPEVRERLGVGIPVKSKRAARGQGRVGRAKAAACAAARDAAPKGTGRQMNRWEREYAERLRIAAAAGEILWWKWESIKLQLADATFYTPDFASVGRDGVLTFHEVKGF